MPLVMVGSVGLFGTGAFAHNAEEVAAIQQHVLSLGTHSVSIREIAQLSKPADQYQLMVRNLQLRSGLTWNELARALGVSRRAVHHWAAGSRLSERNAQRVEEFARLVTRFQGATPDLTRGGLLAPGPDGRSALTAFSEQSQPHRPIPLSTLSVADFLEADEAQNPSANPTATRQSALRAQRLPQRTE
jgi:transcriptional regulator with XRE-family HTH domain